MPRASRMRGGQVRRARSNTAPVSVSVGNVESSNVSGESEKSLAHQSEAESMATLQEIDEAINEDFEVQKLNKEDNAVTEDQNGKETDMVISIGGVAEDMDIKNHEFQLNLGPSQLGEHMLFTAGWVENDRDKKGRKGGACGKIQPGAKGPTWAIQDTESRPNGTWTRMHDRPRDVSDPIIAAKEGPKRKKIN